MQFFSYLINGISLGSVYALIALGYTMVYGIAKMLNFAHGDVLKRRSYVMSQMHLLKILYEFYVLQDSMLATIT